MQAGAMLIGKTLVAGPVYAPEESLPEVRGNRAVNASKSAPALPTRAIVRDEEAAIVGFGPSLKNTWEEIARFKTVWTTSKAHDFLLARGITPTYHLDVDYRQHKASFVTPQPGTQYVLASHVHPDYVAKMLPYRLWLFHSQIPSGGPYESGYPLVEAMMDAGIQAAKTAFDLGYRVQHWFGIDGSFAPTGAMHAGPHEGVLGQAEPHTVRVAGRDYASNGLLVRQALGAEKMLRRYARMRVTIHGDGMLRPFLQERGQVRVE
jgi:hypothetical protein